MGKNLFKIFSALILIILILFVYTGLKNDCLKKIENRIEVITSKSDNLTLNLNNEVDCFDWDKIVLIPRDFESIDMKKRFGIDISEYDVLGFKSFISSDFHTYIIFLDNNEIVGKIDFSSTGYIDNFLTDLNKDIVIIEREDAVFEFVQYENYLKLIFQDTYLNEKYGVSL